MHLLPTVSATFDDIAEPIDLAQPPGDVTIFVIRGQRSYRSRNGLGG